MSFNQSKQQKNLDFVLSLALFFFVLTMIFNTSLNHEPWYDEWQSWNIAKYATSYDLFTKLCRLEGHPPLYYLYLKPFTYLPTFIGMRISSLLPVIFTNYWIIFKMKWKGLKYLLPLTFFIFYQYSVINRVYVLVMALSLLLITFWKEKNNMKRRYTILLCLFSGTGLHSMLVSGLLFTQWMLEDGDIRFNREFFKHVLSQIQKESVISTIFILVHLLYVVILIPVYDIGSITEFGDLNPVIAFTVLFFYTFPAVFGWTNATYANTTIFNDFPMNSEIRLSLLLGFSLFILSYFLFRKFKYYKFFLFSAFVLVSFGTTTRFWQHHTGYLFILMLFLVYNKDNSFNYSLIGKGVFSCLLLFSYRTAYLYHASDTLYIYGLSAYEVVDILRETKSEKSRMVALDMNPININSFFEENLIQSNMKHPYIENIMDKPITYEDIKASLNEWDIIIKYVFPDEKIGSHPLDENPEFVPCPTSDKSYVLYVKNERYQINEKMKEICKTNSLQEAILDENQRESIG